MGWSSPLCEPQISQDSVVLFLVFRHLLPLWKIDQKQQRIVNGVAST